MTIHYSNIYESKDDSSLVVSTSRHGTPIYRTAFKRVLDIFLTILAVPSALPLILILALCIFLRDGKNPFYCQKRVGLGGKIFTMWKLRSMVANADTLLEEHLASNAQARAEWDSKQKLIKDPRITAFGSILRKTSIDELPQLWNVLKGDMSLVGPRPMMPEQRALYPGQAYYQLRPGITGLWQISDRNDTTFSGRAAFDDVYETALSFSTDLRILLATVRVVIRGTGY
jgi:lipopolysaccharide/colanic/teichoic acid biosynthesis glycosyltransferase